MKRIVVKVIVGIALLGSMAMVNVRPQATAVNWHEGPAKVVAVGGHAMSDEANWNS